MKTTEYYIILSILSGLPLLDRGGGFGGSGSGSGDG
jgi:hypothetical protein